MASIFRNQAENRLKAGWRILIFIFFFWCLSAVSLAIKPLFGELTKREFLSDYSLIIVSILAISASIAVLVCRKYLDKKSFKSLGLNWEKRSALDLFFGFFLSAVMAGTFLLFAVLLNVVEIKEVSLSPFNQANNGEGFREIIKHMTWVSLSIFFVEHILVGYWEELVFRGYLYQNMIEGLGLVVSTIISCILYGLIHSANPGASILSTLIIVLFGFLRIYGYLATKMLWLSMGMHIGWNFFQGPFFGFSASGHEMATLFKLDILEPNWLSGGDFGPEASVLIIPIVFAALYLMRLWSKRGVPQN